MGMQFGTVELPQTEGAPEFYVTHVVTEVLPAGAIRYYCGVKRGGSIHWLYTCVMQAEDALRLNAGSREAALLSLDSINGHC